MGDKISQYQKKGTKSHSKKRDKWSGGPNLTIFSVRFGPAGQKIGGTKSHATPAAALKIIILKKWD